VLIEIALVIRDRSVVSTGSLKLAPTLLFLFQLLVFVEYLGGRVSVDLALNQDVLFQMLALGGSVGSRHGFSLTQPNEVLITVFVILFLHQRW
jgi:hypothetical protein